MHVEAEALEERLRAVEAKLLTLRVATSSKGVHTLISGELSKEEIATTERIREAAVKEEKEDGADKTEGES